MKINLVRNPYSTDHQFDSSNILNDSFLLLTSSVSILIHLIILYIGLVAIFHSRVRIRIVLREKAASDLSLFDGFPVMLQFYSSHMCLPVPSISGLKHGQ